MILLNPCVQVVFGHQVSFVQDQDDPLSPEKNMFENNRDLFFVIKTYLFPRTAFSTSGDLVPNGSLASRTCRTTSEASTTFENSLK